MRAPGLPPGFKELTLRDGRRFYEVPMECPDVAEAQSLSKRFCSCESRRVMGRFIWRKSTKHVSGIDWQCLQCYERNSSGLKLKPFLPYVTVVEDRRCQKCGGVGCAKCKTISCEYVNCSTPFEQVEIHHYAPRAMFEDSESYPKGALCRNHHSHWHKIINSVREN